MLYLVTGGAGFIGSNIVERLVPLSEGLGETYATTSPVLRLDPVQAVGG